VSLERLDLLLPEPFEVVAFGDECPPVTLSRPGPVDA